MKTASFLTLFILAVSTSFAQVGKLGWDMPSETIKTLDGTSFDTGKIENGGKPIIVSFWATWCKPCIKELSAIADEYDDWTEETGVKLIAISIDDARNSAKVKPFINGKDWDYEVYIDSNQDLKRAMNVNNVPHTFLLDGNKKVVYSHNSYAPGDEDELYEKVQALVK